MLSVALCTYNGQKFLTQQLQSILNQSLPINEIIICDDGSKDDTLNIIKNFQLSFPNTIKLYVNEVSLGAIKNFEKAIGLCSGDIIFLSDQDDIWLINKVEKIISKFNAETHIEAIFTDAELIDDKGNSLNKLLFNELPFSLQTKKDWASGKALLDLIYYRNKITGATLAFKNSVYQRAYPFPNIDNFWHDAYLGIHAAANNGLGWIDEALIQYRIHHNQQIGIGNGTTINKNAENITARQFLLDSRQFFANCLLMANSISEKYPNLNSKTLVKEAFDWIHYLDIRLKLPTNFFKRVFKVIINAKSYRKHGRFFVRMAKDIINPM